MNRPIKFRAWDTILNRYLDAEAHFSDEVSITPDEWSRANFVPAKFEADQKHIILEQSTGLTDKNETEVYEGDILRIEGWELLWVVRWVALAAAFQPCMAQTGSPMRHFNWLDQGVNGIYMQDTKTTSLFEVIGNIHENPELLGGD